MNPIRKGLAIAVIVLLAGVSIPTTGTLMSDDDTTPPITTHSLSPEMPNGENGWYVSDVTVTLNATDDMSGVNSTYYRINNGIWKNYSAPFKVKGNGDYPVEYYSVDNAGNVEEIKQTVIKIDKSEPDGDFYYEGLFRKIRFFTEIYDEVSGVEKVEFYLDSELMFTDYEEPYEWISDYTIEHHFHGIAYDFAGNVLHSAVSSPPGNNHVKGLIFSVNVTEKCVTFYAILVKYHISTMVPYNGIYLLRRCKFRNDFTGKIYPFWIDATFYHHF